LSHKQTAKNIAISRKKLQDIYNSAHDGIFIFTFDGHVIDSNDTMLKMFNVTRQDALRFNVNRIFQSSYNKDVDLQTIWQEALKGNDQEFKWLTKTQDRDGISTVQVNLRRSLWGDDFIIIATIRDITLQVEAMEATIAANRAKSEFLANISHELRTPIHGILGYARLGIKRSDSLSREKLNEYFSTIQESGTRLMHLLNNVLDFSKLEVGKMRYNMRKNDLLPRIYQVVTELNPSAAEKGLTFKIECASQQIVVFCDQEKIAQVLRNLLFNAVKFSNENNSIRIISKEINCDTDSPKQQITVSNIGVPIPADELDSIFDKFVQSSVTNTGAGGTGLGLAISKQILQDHNSTIWAENGSNGEALFCFLLPVKADQIQESNKE
jgi:PAS domain S-box-containing protein